MRAEAIGGRDEAAPRGVDNNGWGRVDTAGHGLWRAVEALKSECAVEGLDYCAKVTLAGDAPLEVIVPFPEGGNDGLYGTNPRVHPTGGGGLLNVRVPYSGPNQYWLIHPDGTTTELPLPDGHFFVAYEVARSDGLACGMVQETYQGTSAIFCRDPDGTFRGGTSDYRPLGLGMVPGPGGFYSMSGLTTELMMFLDPVTVTTREVEVVGFTAPSGRYELAPFWSATGELFVLVYTDEHGPSVVHGLLQVADGVATNVPLPAGLPTVSDGAPTLVVTKDFLVFTGDQPGPAGILRVPR